MGLYRSRPMPFGQRLAASIRQHPLVVSTRKVPKHANVYTCGEREGKVYLIESGLIKTVVLSPDGKQCLSSIFTTNDVFGELCLAGGERVETATAMEDSVLKQMACAEFLALVNGDGLEEVLSNTWRYVSPASNASSRIWRRSTASTGWRPHSYSWP
jgi:CRP/FNR family transcriptional regulator, cyclic AMP receptor protein